MASYYQQDLHDACFFPSADWQLLPDGEEREGSELHD